MRKIFLLAAMPFIAIWKKEPSSRSGEKEVGREQRDHEKALQGDRARGELEERHADARRSAAKGDDVHDDDGIELHAQHLHRDDAETLGLLVHLPVARVVGLVDLERGEALQVLQEAVTQRRVLVPVGSEQALRDSLYDHDHEGDERHEHEQDDRGRHADGRRDGKQRDRREQGIEELGQVLAKVGLELLGTLD